MSGLASVLGYVEQKVAELLAGFTTGETEQNERLDALEARVTALETSRVPESKAASPRPGARKTAAPAGTASATASAADAR